MGKFSIFLRQIGDFILGFFLKKNWDFSLGKLEFHREKLGKLNNSHIILNIIVFHRQILNDYVMMSVSFNFRMKTMCIYIYIRI